MRLFNLLICLIALTVTAACEESPTTGPSQNSLSGSRLTLTDTGGDAASGPMVMQLYPNGQGDMTYAGLDFTYNWVARGNQLCLSNLQMGGMPSSDPTAQCAQVAISGSTVTVDGLGAGATGERMTGTIAPL